MSSPRPPGARPASSWAARAATLLLAVNLGALVYFQLVSMRDWFSSDTATKVLVADEMVRQASPLLADWTYVNGDLWLFFPHLAVLPFLPLFGPGFLAHALGGLLTAGLLLWAAHALLRRLGAPPAARILAVAALASGFAPRTAWFLYGDYTYGWVLLVALATLLLVLRAADPDRRGRFAPAPAAFALAFAAHANSPERALVYAALPAIAAGAMELVAARRAGAAPERTDRSALARCLAALAGGAIAGSALHATLLDRVINVWGAAASAYLPLTQVPASAGYTLLALVHALGGEPEVGLRLATVAGGAAALRLALAAALLVAPWVALRRAWPAASPSLRLAAGFAGAATALVLFAYTLSTTPDFRNPVAMRDSARYLLPPLVLVLLVAAAAIRRAAAARWPARLMVVAALVFALGFPATLLRGNSAQREKREAVLATLAAEGLTYGFASYWNAPVYTALSGGEVRIRQIEIRDRLLPMRHLASNLWFRSDAWHGPTFLLLDAAELKLAEEKGLLDCPVKPVRRLAAGGYTILVFAENPADRLLGWNDADEAWNVPICLSSSTLRQVGTYSAGALRSAGGEKGFLMYGPYVSLSAGRYRATIEYEAGPGPARFEIVAGTSTIATEPLPASAGLRREDLDFELAEPLERLEVRVFVDGAAATIRSAALQRLPPGQAGEAKPPTRPD
jgi:hypothetical protein